MSKAQRPFLLYEQPGIAHQRQPRSTRTQDSPSYDLSIGTTASLLWLGSASISKANCDHDLHDESHLLGRSHVGALHDLHNEVSRERHDGRRDESVRVGPVRGGQRSIEAKEGSEVERGQRVEDNDLVCRVGVDALVQREGDWAAVQGRVGRRVVLAQPGMVEARDEFLQEALALSGGNGCGSIGLAFSKTDMTLLTASNTVVVVKRNILRTKSVSTWFLQ